MKISLWKWYDYVILPKFPCNDLSDIALYPFYPKNFLTVK